MCTTGCDGYGILALWVSKSFGWVAMGGPWTTTMMKLSRGWHWGISFTPSLWSNDRTFTACYTWGSVNEQAISNAESMAKWKYRGYTVMGGGKVSTPQMVTQETLTHFATWKIHTVRYDKIWILQCFGVNANILTFQLYITLKCNIWTIKVCHDLAIGQLLW